MGRFFSKARGGFGGANPPRGPAEKNIIKNRKKGSIVNGAPIGGRAPPRGAPPPHGPHPCTRPFGRPCICAHLMEIRTVFSTVKALNSRRRPLSICAIARMRRFRRIFFAGDFFSCRIYLFIFLFGCVCVCVFLYFSFGARSLGRFNFILFSGADFYFVGLLSSICRCDAFEPMRFESVCRSVVWACVL